MTAKKLAFLDDTDKIPAALLPPAGAGPSGLKMAAASATGGATIAAGLNYFGVPFTSVDQGEDVWGVPDSALVLALTRSVDNLTLLYPDEDAVYDVDVLVRVNVNSADAGKAVRLVVDTNGASGLIQDRIILPAETRVDFKINLTDYVFLGDLAGGPGLNVGIKGNAVANDMSLNQAYVLISQRG